jgi:hypothetical protein
METIVLGGKTYEVTGHREYMGMTVPVIRATSIAQKHEDGSVSVNIFPETIQLNGASHG